MSIISFSNITKTFGQVRVFDGLTISFHPGQKVGLIGPNGSGKTTLFRMILGLEKPDTGAISVQKDLRIGYLPQEPDFEPGKTVFEIMHEGLRDLMEKQDRLERISSELGTLGGQALKQTMADYDRLARELELEGGWSAEARIRSVLTGLGLAEELHHMPVSTLSGGQLSRLGLARVLLRETDLLLLDEPTNHLDLQAICWLETFLRNYVGAVLLISHDRFLLDQLAERIVEIEGRKAVSYTGNYSQFVELKQQNQLHQERQLTQRQEFVRRTLDFIARNKDRWNAFEHELARNKDQEGMRKTARGRKKRLERLLSEQPDFLEQAEGKQTISIRFSGSVSRSEKIVRAEGVSKSFGDLTLFRGLSLDLPRGGRLAITGPNGTGKSTLLKILVGQLAQDEGTVERGENLSFGYLDQQALTLDQEKTVLEEVTGVRPDLTPEALRNRLAGFLFRGDQVFQKVQTLSGGQRNRLMLCKLVLSEPDVLILDEPTNHLDIDSCELFEEALLEYGGSVIAVSHDRYFIDRVFDELLLIGLNSAGQRCMGSIDWVRKMEGDEGVFSSWNEQSRQAAAELSGTRLKDKEAAASKKETVKTPPELRRFNKLSIDELENAILCLEEEIGRLVEDFGQEKIYKNPDELKDLQDRVSTKKEDLSLLYRAYERRLNK